MTSELNTSAEETELQQETQQISPPRHYRMLKCGKFNSRIPEPLVIHWGATYDSKSTFTHWFCPSVCLSSKCFVHKNAIFSKTKQF